MNNTVAQKFVGGTLSVCVCVCNDLFYTVHETDRIECSTL